MLAGAKPLAMFRDGVGYTHHFPEAEFAPHVARGAIIRREEIHRGAGPVATLCVYFALPGEEWRIEAADAIDRGEGRGARSIEEDEIAMGRLLGYTEDEIAAYLAHSKAHRRV